jgi:hypothetical protein
MNRSHILDGIIFVGGPPRSGTTFAAKSLNLHPVLVTAIDDHVYECWGLYYYRERSGLVQELRSRDLTPEEAQQILKNHLIDNDQLVGVASSDKVKSFNQVAKRSSGEVRSILDNDLERHSIPLAQFPGKWRLCLKSPEISFVLPQLARHFPCAKFVLVYRSIIEIAESMYRIGNVVKRFPVYHKRWIQEKKGNGELLLPPGIPGDWNGLWQNTSDFQRCIIYAASYMHALMSGISKLSSERYFVYNHEHLRNSPRQIFQQLAEFLAVDVCGFQMAETQIKMESPSILAKLQEEYSAIEIALSLKKLTHKIESVSR